MSETSPFSFKCEPKPLFYKEVGSTSDLAQQAALDNAPEFTCFYADTQTKGRGRQGRTWYSLGPASLEFSFVLHQASSLLPLMVSLSVMNVLKKELNLDVEIKWPNDLLIKGKKCSGILVEHYKQPKSFYIVGVGINLLNPLTEEDEKALEEVGATTVAYHTAFKHSVHQLLDLILLQIQKDLQTLNKVGFVAFKEIYQQNCSTFGKDIIARTQTGDIAGQAIELTDRGSLILKTDNGLKEIVAAETIMEKSL